MAQVLLSVVTLAVMIFALVDIITSDNWRVKHLPKIAWVLLVIFLPLIGSVLWFVLGKEREARSEPFPTFGDPRRRETAVPQRSSTEDDLAAVEREIQFHERQAEIGRLEAKLEAKRKTDPTA